jgi:hypothetical protein
MYYVMVLAIFVLAIFVSVWLERATTIRTVEPSRIESME